MVDLVRDFAYAQITAPVAAGNPGDTLVLTVDSNARLPINSDLAAYDFWMTIESTLVVGAFEILKVLSTTATTVTALRGQDGTPALAHPSGMYLKGSITAAMYRRAQAYRRYVDLGNVTSAGRAVVSITLGQPRVMRTLVGTSAGRAVPTGSVLVAFKLAGTSAGRSTVTGSLTIPVATKQLAGTSVGQATSTGALTGTTSAPKVASPAIAIRPIGVGAI